MIRLHVIIGSVRPVRVGLPVGLWIEAQAKGDGRFEVTLVDLAEVNLPFLDEPEMPHLGKYTHEHTKAWSRTIDAADAFIFVMPEYNAGVSPALKNALDFLSAEWKHKAVGLVSYGGISGGQRAVQLLKPTLLQLNLMPVPAAVQGDAPVEAPEAPESEGSTDERSAAAAARLQTLAASFGGASRMAESQ